jgi:hypothetical protein
MFKCKEGCSECCGIFPISNELLEKYKDKFQIEITKIVETSTGKGIITKDLKKK